MSDTNAIHLTGSYAGSGIKPLVAGSVARAAPEQRKAMLRQAADEMVGTTFFAEMLKIARNTKLKGGLGHGGRGEEVFGGQLDQELARRAGAGLKNSLSAAIYNRLVNNV